MQKSKLYEESLQFLCELFPDYQKNVLNDYLQVCRSVACTVEYIFKTRAESHHAASEELFLL
jgi:hypothetical protein